ncbi:GNAT family N-acetyltransferase [Phytohabitans sp. ZYX-F-186]|uniref:GNAT family N-acetyltransferase n=1 Tax=Phytohabitans maris TaxID=3071409 RepID=A0ABU0ZV16_9ACTN|nr:GNAT family N-acetyltransferase [Phytohabitans sp. ZYX-F-186]MDQ7910626.1 GNAT family N-acetyltransferase [Phytohabitans sp. ZYX-F-186]
MTLVEISFEPPGAAADAGFLAQATDLVNRVYADAEKGIWHEGAERTSPEELAGIVRAGELATARLGGQLVGAVRVRRLASGEGEFGMLVASPDHRGTGLGRRLVEFAEGWALDRGLATMQLELLVPREWTHPVKQFLHEWYTRIGYRPVRGGSLADDYPALAPLLATPCDFVIYHKPLSR